MQVIFAISTAQSRPVICAGEAAQMYYTAVNDHVYGAYLVTLEPFTSGTTRDAGQYCKIAGGVWALLGGVLRAMALQGLRLHCAFCSKTELVKPEQQAAVVKVSQQYGLYYCCIKYVLIIFSPYGLGTSSSTLVASLHSLQLLYMHLTCKCLPEQLISMQCHCHGLLKTKDALNLRFSLASLEMRSRS